LGFNIKTNSINATKKGKKKSHPMDIFDENIFETAEHNINYNKRITKLTCLQTPKCIQRTIKSLTLQFSFESDLVQSKSMDKSKHNEPYKHEEEFLHDNICDEMCTPISIIEKLHAMLEDWKKKLHLNIIYCEIATWRKVDDMF
jgi:hypothetical protein